MNQRVSRASISSSIRSRSHQVKIPSGQDPSIPEMESSYAMVTKQGLLVRSFDNKPGVDPRNSLLLERALKYGREFRRRFRMVL